MTQRREVDHHLVEVGDGDLHVTSLLVGQHEHAVLDEDATLDEKTLGALGYKQEFRRYDELPCHSFIHSFNCISYHVFYLHPQSTSYLPHLSANQPTTQPTLPMQYDAMPLLVSPYIRTYVLPNHPTTTCLPPYHA